MLNGVSKKVVVIKDVKSNFIEEAILILKGSPDNVVYQNPKDPAAKKNKEYNDFLLKEAEAIINNYLKDTNMQKEVNVGKAETEKSGKSGRSKIMAGLIINMALIGSIALLIFILTRMI